MDGKELGRLKAEGQRLDATVHVSSLEPGEQLVAELANQLKKRGLVKVKMLKECAERGKREQVAGRLAELTGSVLVEVRGNTALLYRDRGR